MSNEFSKLEEITLYREQAKIALETGQAINPEKNSFVYNDYVLYKIILCAMEKVELQNLIHNSIFIIKDYDEKNNTQYLDTLKNYILNQYSIGNVSKLMHIHRNTLTYRLKKIEELADINLNENQILAHLQLSFYILSIVEKS
jgi:DNA-binding PucR family transcriptional regulator